MRKETSGNHEPRRSLIFRIGRLLGRGLFLLVLLITLVIGFGSTAQVQSDLSVFTAASRRWQEHPDFRKVSYEYVVFGSRAMRTRPLGLTASDWIIWIRSLPIMPKNFALNDTSRAHYFNFSQGPLSAYLFLCYEQDLADENGYGYFLAEMEQLCVDGVPSDDPNDARHQRVVAWLRDKMKVDGITVAHDTGAVRSLALLLRETYPTPHNPYKVRPRHADKLLRKHAMAIAQDLGYVAPGAPPQPDLELPILQALSYEQQLNVLQRLDGYVREKEPELWRTKQVSDLLGGIWAQVYGPPYGLLLEPYNHIVNWCRLIAVTMLIALLVHSRRLIRQLHRDRRWETAASPEV
jgi:hypothetical protein